MTTPFCTRCGRPAERCDGRCRPGGPERFCGTCGRRLVSDVTPGGHFSPRCRDHG